jgi:hypothetical protein
VGRGRGGRDYSYAPPYTLDTFELTDTPSLDVLDAIGYVRLSACATLLRCRFRETLRVTLNTTVNTTSDCSTLCASILDSPAEDHDTGHVSEFRCEELELLVFTVPLIARLSLGPDAHVYDDDWVGIDVEDLIAVIVIRVGLDPSLLDVVFYAV